MKKKYIVRLTQEERDYLENLVKKGKTQAHRIKHANILLSVDANGTNMQDHEAAKIFRCHRNTACNVRERFVNLGFEAAIERKEQDKPSRALIFDGEKEARLIALACGRPPEGRTRWTLKLLADKMVELDIVESVSDQTVRRALKKTNCSLTGASVG